MIKYQAGARRKKRDYKEHRNSAFVREQRTEGKGAKTN